MKDRLLSWTLAASLTLALALPAPATEAPNPPTETSVAGQDTQPELESAAPSSAEVTPSSSGRARNRRPAPAVVFGKDFILNSNATAQVVVVLGGSGTIRGRVSEAVVSIGGDVEIDGGTVGAEVVSVLGNIKVGPHSNVRGDAISVGGEVEVSDSATVHGAVQPFPFQIPGLKELRAWVVHCALKLRLLSPDVGWSWMVFGAFFLCYLLVALALPRPVQVCVEELTRRPATTFFMAILTKLLIPVVLLVLSATVIGVLVIPFLLAALVFGALVGKVAFLEYLGNSLGKLLGVANLKPALALVIGSALLALLYLIPILALIVFAVTGLWGFGAAVTASFASLRRETNRPPVAAKTTSPQNSPAVMPAAVAGMPTEPLTAAPATAAPLETEPPVGEGFFAGPTPSLPPATAAPAGAAYSLPRATFWERLGAGILDLVLAGALCGIVHGPPFGFLVMLAYFVGMWAWRGTTVGGVVANLRVVRLDDQPVTVAVALVRGLGGAFSAMVFFLGFLWILWDPERQGWHDKLAGTIVVRERRSRPLV